MVSWQVEGFTSWRYAEVDCSVSPHVIRNVVKRLEDYAFFTKFAIICAQLRRKYALCPAHVAAR